MGVKLQKVVLSLQFWHLIKHFSVHFPIFKKQTTCMNLNACTHDFKNIVIGICI